MYLHNLSPYYISHAQLQRFVNPSLMLEFKLLPRTEEFSIYSTHKCIHGGIVQWGQQQAKMERSMQYTKALKG
jgi:hypothetical protein